MDAKFPTSLPGKACGNKSRGRKEVEEEVRKGTRFEGIWGAGHGGRAGEMTVPSPSPQGARQHLLRPPSSPQQQ